MTTRKIIPLLLAAALTLTLALAGCAESNEPKDTPVRVGTLGTIHGSLDVPLTLEEIIEECDLIADVTIIEWLGESRGEDEATFFRAQVNNVIMGEEREIITLRQNGNSEWTFDDYPLFKNGDRLFLFLKNAVNTEDYEFIIRGVHVTTYEIQEHEGEIYILDRFRAYTEKFNELEGVQVLDKELEYSIIEQIHEIDPIRAEIEREYQSVFIYDDFTDVVTDMVEEVRRR